MVAKNAYQKNPAKSKHQTVSTGVYNNGHF